MNITKMVRPKDEYGKNMVGSCRYCNSPGVDRMKNSETGDEFELCEDHRMLYNKVTDKVTRTKKELEIMNASISG